MSGLTRALARAAVRAYPTAWRARYGEELDELIVELRLRPRDLVDLVRGAARERVNAATPGGVPMPEPVAGWRARALAVLAVIAALPTLAFMLVNVLQYNLRLLPEGSAWYFIRIGLAPEIAWLLPGLPLLALALAAASMARFDLDRSTEGGIVVSARYRPHRMATIAALFSAVILAAVIAYGVSESLLEGLRAS
jgi:hypothetical protein